MTDTASSGYDEYHDPKYAYVPGGAYPTLEAKTPDDYLASALRAERYIASRQREDADGLHWTPDEEGDNVCLTLYAGSAGLAFLYSQLARITGNDDYRDIAIRAARHVAAHWKDIVGVHTHVFTHDTSTMPSYEVAEVGAAAEVLLDLGERYDVPDLVETAKTIGHWYADTAQRDEHGAYWTGTTPLTFDGGVILYLIRLARSVHEEWLDTLLRDAAEWFLAQGDPAGEDGLKFNGYKTFRTYETLNFAYGTSGSGYLLTLLYDALGDERYLEAAKACERYLATQFIPQEKGALLPYLLNGDEPTFYYLGHCHGPAGTSKFYYRLYEETGDERYLKVIEDMVDGLESWGAPEHMSKGLWNTPNQCCGVAGLAQFFIGLYAADVNGHRARWKKLAERTAAVLLGWEYRRQDGSSDWPVAWRRVCPKDIGPRIGLIDGTAGVAAVLLQLYTLEHGEYEWPRFVNDPFPARAVTTFKE
ncbi:hypothetical protein JS531_08760 [Bifidobacterium sp. CP2]|uniref:lanthionine synthetase LanC family protein n=1 Tax=Bifidobacterium sp. CP2 TaxID=2809025 RepID=UPI001BDDA4E0|nr:lanthionine synthetase LanC family protein [Bifidobacterium sp. CP2]MBT1182031.1 hypothetical protein [Bifidobacterium sp. CP2]